VPHVAIIGAGPSGIFAAAALLARPELSVDVFDRLPTPFGLVRYGVAPDHTKIKSVTAALAKVFADPRARFFGNVTLGTDLTVEDLCGTYDGVLVATGTPHARRLEIPGENLAGNYAAGDLVSWYNGHPYAGTPYTTAADAIAVIGAGNVSLDIARVLLKAGAGLTATDAPDSVLTALDRHPVREVHVVARRGAADVKFSPAELLELEKMTDVDLVVDPADVDLAAAITPRYDTDRTVATRVEIFRRWTTRTHRKGVKQLRFRFMRSPVAVLGEDHVTGLRLQLNAGGPDGSIIGATGTEDLPVQAVVRSIGYSGDPLFGLPFDRDRGLIPNVDGRIGPGIYATGWIKRGPSGVIGSNKACAIQTVSALLADFDAAAPDTSSTANALARTDLIARLGAHPEPHRRLVTWEGWSDIDAAEIALGAACGRARTKITDPRRLVDIGARRAG
jgi:ferredoxin--NADP+ reductase